MAGNPVSHLLQLRALSVLPDLHTLTLGSTPLSEKYPAKDLRVVLRNIIPGTPSSPFPVP